ncbi:EF-hand domain-containing protein [Brevundimonas sp.]|uniref:EF-hand domain-containing protein n=1 Tax=Brevundimonas sp. TaxID=1871086 RepID=UPI002D700FEF|nr:EF-hand domain-containing protein [Brevundimonas sp.]HYC73242.1 EF-hand domain-containing protein [Brevundimonas sp.]
MLTLIALSAALIQEPPAPPAPPEVHTRVMVMGPHGPGSLDKDGDGQVSREEFAAPLNDHFGQMDTNGDGRLSTEEMAGGHGPRGDGNVMIAHGGPEGAPGVHRFEMRRPHPGGEAGARQEHEIIIRGPGGHGMPHVIHRPGHEGRGGETRFEVRSTGGPGHHADMDKDGDGKVSEAEFTGPLREAFARMDADHSGYIEEGERGGDGGVRVFTHCIETRAED